MAVESSLFHSEWWCSKNTRLAGYPTGHPAALLKSRPDLLYGNLPHQEPVLTEGLHIHYMDIWEKDSAKKMDECRIYVYVFMYIYV